MAYSSTTSFTPSGSDISQAPGNYSTQMSKLNASSLCMFHITCIFVEEGEPFGGPLRFAIMVVLCNMLSYDSAGRGPRITRGILHIEATNGWRVCLHMS